MPTKSCDQVEKEIAAVLKQKDQAQKSRSILEEKRRAVLLDGGNSAALDKLDSEIASALKTETRAEERLALLHEDLGRLTEDEKQLELAGARRFAEHLRISGEKCIREYEAHCAEIVNLLRKLVVIDDEIKSVNRRLTEGGLEAVSLPNELRRQPITYVPESIEVIEERAAGVYTGDGRPIDPGTPAAQKVSHTTPSKRLGGLLPTPLQNVVVLPAGSWGGPGWFGPEKSFNHSDGATPRHARDETDAILAELRASAD